MKAMTPQQRRELFDKTKCTLTNFGEDKFEEVMMVTVDMVCGENKFSTFEEEQDAFHAIIKATYTVSEKDSKN